MEERGLLSMDDAMIKYCVSWFAIRVANVGTTIAVDSWNQHTLRGKSDKKHQVHVCASIILLFKGAEMVLLMKS